jgi:hypothetical protein
MLIVRSQNRIPIRLTEERWQHIIHRHPEMIDQMQRVLETVEQPEMIQQGDFGELLAVRFYSKTPLTSKHLIVAYREVDPDDGFILTAYLTRQPSLARKIIWKH